MQNFTTNAINLKSYNLSETDKIVVMYSKEKGIIKGVAKGVKKNDKQTWRQNGHAYCEQTAYEAG